MRAFTLCDDGRTCPSSEYRGQEEPFGSKVQSPRNFVMGKSLLDELGKGE